MQKNWLNNRCLGLVRFIFYWPSPQDCFCFCWGRCQKIVVGRLIACFAHVSLFNDSYLVHSIRMLLTSSHSWACKFVLGNQEGKQSKDTFHVSIDVLSRNKTNLKHKIQNLPKTHKQKDTWKTCTVASLSMDPVNIGTTPPYRPNCLGQTG